MTVRARSKTSLFAIFGLVVAGLVATGCQESTLVESSPGDEPAVAEATDLSKSAHGSSPMSPAMVLRARLHPLGTSGVKGEVTVRIKGDHLGVSVNAEGFPRGETKMHPQHIHSDDTCGGGDGPGGIFVTLDDDLSNAPGNPSPSATGDSYPTATAGGTVNYRESDSKSAVERALGGMGLDLANRTVVVHKANFALAACGELDPVGQ